VDVHACTQLIRIVADGDDISEVAHMTTVFGDVVLLLITTLDVPREL